jgi:hypothetical protein
MEAGLGDLLSRLLPSLRYELRKQLIKFPGKLLLGRERGNVY